MEKRLRGQSEAVTGGSRGIFATTAANLTTDATSRNYRLARSGEAVHTLFAGKEGAGGAGQGVSEETALVSDLPPLLTANANPGFRRNGRQAIGETSC